MLNEVKHLYNKDSSLTLRMTVSVIIYIVTFFSERKTWQVEWKSVKNNYICKILKSNP